MKNLLRAAALAICAIFTVANAGAQVITAERASEIANQFFANGKQKSAAFRSTNATLTQSIDSRAVTGEINDAPTFHILTGADGKGFVIVSGEETENPIIGYSFDGTIDTSNLPDGFVDYMTDINAQVRALREYNAANPQKAAAARSAMQRTNYNATSMGNIQVLLETAKWGQHEPFNTQCYTDATGTTYGITGCVPIAFAIIMRYHEWPNEGSGKLCNMYTGNEITDRVYEWDKMPLVYDSNASEEQKNAVAKLVSHLGHAYTVNHTNGNGNEGASTENLYKYFNYNNVSGNKINQDGIDTDINEWIANIKGSLDNGCPIPYASDKISGSGDTRHIFVLDGYTDNNYFHINFGWAGSGDGWFLLTAINGLGSDYSWAEGSGHRAFFNLMPNKTPRTVTASVSPTGAGSVTVNGSANSAEVIEGTTATLVATANSGYTFSHWSKGGAEVGTDMTYKAKVAAEGNDYVANFYTIGSSINIPVNYDSNMGSVTYNGNIVSATGFNPNEYSEVTLTAEANDGYMFTGWEIVEGTESTESSEKSITFIAKSGIEVTAHFALAGGEYKINKDNITPSGGNNSYCPTWIYNKTGDIEEILTLSTANGSTPVNALSKTSNRLYAHAYDDSSNSFREITYTLTAKEGFVITGYSLTYVVGSSYKGEVTVRNATQSLTPNDTEEHTLTYQYANAARSSAYGTRTAEFVLSSTTAHNSQYITIKDLSVTVLSEGAEGGESTTTTHTINVTAGEGGTATVNGNSSATVTEGESVTLAATAANDYTFTGWYKDAEKVSGNTNYTFTPTESASYEARFVAKAVSNCNIPTDNTLRYYRFAIAIAPNSYTTDFGSNYENVKKFWQECEDFMNEVYVPLGMCFDVVIDQRLLLGTDLPINNDLPEISGVTDLINNAIGSGSYDVGLCISYRDNSAENTGLSAVNGAYTSTTKANGYAQADKWVVAHEAGHLFGADHTTEGESSLMDNIGEFFSYPSIKKIRDASVNSGPGNAYKSEVVANNAPTFTAQMKNTYRIPKGACLSIPVYASDADGHSLRYAAIGCSSSTVGNITGGGTMPHFASLKPQTSNIIDYRPKYVADGDSYYLPVDGTNIPSMSAGSYSIAILVNDMPEGNSYDYLNSNPFYSNYDVWDATVEIVDGNPFTASISPAQNSYTAGSDVTVTWGVNNSVFTEDSRVRITMSTDYGKTFSHVLADDVRALDGSKAVTLPNVNVGNVDVDFSNKYVNAVRSMRAGIIRVEIIDGAAYTLTTLSPENGGGFNITDGGAEPDPTPVTYAITTAANPAEGGTAKFSVGTGSQKTEGNVNDGELITLYATANTGYNFVNWTLNSTEVSTDATCNVTATQAANYVANFEPEANEPVEPTDPLAGKFFRLKVKNTSNYMNIANTSENTGSTSGVTVVAKNESSDTQIFLFEQSGDGYKLKANSGNYIKCHAWNANANTTSANDATVLTFETTGNELEYLIKWNNTNMNQGVERDDYFKAENGYVYCDAAIGSATTWVLEEVIPSNEKTLTVTYSGATWNNESSGWWVSVVTNTTPAVTVRTTDGTPKIGYSTVNSVRHPYLLDGNSFTISVPANCKITGYRLGYQAHNLVSKSVTYTNGKESTGTVTIAQSDEQNTLTVTGLDNNEISFSVEDQTTQAGFIIKSLEITYVEDTDLETYTVAVTAGENGTATASAATVVEGDNVTLTATANTYYKFVGWYNGETKVSEANPYTFAVTSNINYEARFEELFPDGAYKVYWQADNRGYLAYHGTDYPNEAKLAGVTYSGCQNLHYGINDADLVWYLITASDGKRYLFEVATGKFLGVDTSVQANGTGNKLSTSEAWAIAVEENTKHTGHYIITTMISGTKNLLCSGCGTPKEQHPVRWLTVNDTNQTDGGAPLQLVKVDDVTVADNVMNAVRAVIEPRTFKFQAEIEGWRNDNPNTHLGTITIGGTAMKLTPEHLTASELTMPLNAGTTLAFTRKYRGFEFQGFYIGETSLGTNPTLTAENVAAINETTPLVAKFTATDDVTLFYDDDTYSYRIPAIAKTGNGMLVAVSDYRHNLDDIGRDNHGTGTKRIDLVMRTSTDNGATWSETKTIAAGDNSKADSYLRAFGDAAIAAVGQNIVVMAAAGDVVYTAGTTSSPNKMARIYSTDNGATWTIEEMTTKMYSQSTSLIPSGGSAFFGSGKLAVDPNFNGTGNARIYGALLVRIGTDGYNNFGVFSDDLGATWKILGGDNTNPVAKGDEPKVEILPNGQILLSARRGGGRVFRVFTYGNDKANGAGSWGDAAVNGCDNGGSNATNGEIICLDAKRPNGLATKILLQSQPKGGPGTYDRYNVTIWYKEVSANETYTAAEIASGWTQGLEVSPADVKSAYSAMCLQENGEIAFFFEEAPCYGDDHTKGYSMVYVPLTIEEITNNNFLNPNADVEYVPTEFNIVLTDAQDNEYRETLDYIPADVAAVESYLTTTYPFIKLGTTGAIADNKYTNTVTLPFKVSNAENAYWHNIYWPANGTSAGEFYPIYLKAETENATYITKLTEYGKRFGESQYNTYEHADKLGWAVYSVNNTLTFKFKNKLTGKFMAVNGVVSSGNADNVIFTDEAGATVFTLEKYTGANTAWGDYGLKSVYNGTTGYVCNTSAGYANATNYTGTGHPGAWVEFGDADYDLLISNLDQGLILFGNGNDKRMLTTEIQAIIDAMGDYNNPLYKTMLLKDLKAHFATLENAINNWPKISLTIAPVGGGTTKIAGEANVTSKYVPTGQLTVEAVPASGYRFTHWSNGTTTVSTDASYTFNINAATELTANFEIEESQDELTNGYYHLINRDTNRHEHLYNNAFSSENSYGYTLQSDNMVNTNNGIWHITKNGNQLGIKNGDGKPVVAGKNHNGGVMGTYSALNIIGDPIKANDGYTYYYFDEALNCSNHQDLQVGGINYLTTWSGYPNAIDNHWRLERVDTDGKHIYDVVVDCTEEDVYVTYGSGTSEEYAFNGGFFITDATITAGQVTAKKGNDAAQGVTVLVEGNTIRVIDAVVYHTITVSTYYDNKGGTVKVGEEDATSVNVAEGNSVRMLATVADGYEFMGWLKDGVIVKNAIDGGLDFEIQGPDYTLYEVKASAEYVAVFSKITETTGLEDGKAYRICGVQGNGRARCIYRDGNTLKWKYDYDNNDVNTIFVAQKNGNAINLISAVGYHGWKASNMLGNNEQYNPYAAIKVTYGTRDELRTLYIESGTSSGLFQTNTDGAFSFQNSRGGGLTMIATDEATSDFLFEEVDTYAFQVSAADGSNAKLGTVNLPFATTVPTDVTVYGVNDSNEDYVYVAPLELTDNVLPANTPVLIEAAASGKYGFKPAPASANVYETGFAGTLEAEAIPGTTNAYILSYKGVGTPIKMYKLSSTDRTINANKAYFIEATGKASALQFVFGGTTDIEEVEREGIEDAIYDLQGRKLSEITEPGIYIVGGKKVWIK